ncbi:MAG: hypothetical protein ACFB4I_01135 [Cyanophyceae cyanobacterium]
MVLIPGVTVVISPLIALQQDQVESINEELTSEAAIVNSTITKSDRLSILLPRRPQHPSLFSQ